MFYRPSRQTWQGTCVHQSWTCFKSWQPRPLRVCEVQNCDRKRSVPSGDASAFIAVALLESFPAFSASALPAFALQFRRCTRSYMGQKRKRGADTDQENAVNQIEDQPEQDKLTPYELQRQRLCVLPTFSTIRIISFPVRVLCAFCTFKMRSLSDTKGETASRIYLFQVHILASRWPSFACMI